MLPDSLVNEVNNNDWMPAVGQDGLTMKIALISNSLGYWETVWDRIKRNHELIRGNMWDDLSRAQIEASGRIPVQLPVVEPMIRNLIGRLVSMRQEWKIYPAISRDQSPDPSSPIPVQIQQQQQYIQINKKCELAETAMNGIAQASDWNECDEAYVFEDECCGLGWATVEENTTNEGHTQLLLRRVDWREIMFDPASKRPDLEDCRWLARIVWRTIPEAIELYPDKRDVILGYRGKQDDFLNQTLRFQTANYPQYENYFIPIVEFYERHRFEVFTLIDPNSDNTIEQDFFSMQEAQAEFQQRTLKQQQDIQQAMVDPMGALSMPPQPLPMTIVQHFEPRIVRTCYIGVEILAEDMTECDKFPYVPFFQFYDAGSESLLFWGMVDVLRNPQEYINRTFAQLDYAVQTAIKNLILVHEEGLKEGFTKEDLAREVARTAPVISIREGVEFDEAMKLVPQGQFPDGYMQMIQAIRSILDGILPNDAYGSPMPGSQGGSPSQSGRAIALQQSAADMGTEVIFQHHQFSMKQLGELLLYDLQTNVDEPTLVEYLTKEGAMQWVALNDSPENSIYDERFVVTVGEQNYSPSQRAQQNNQLLQLLQNQAIFQMMVQGALPPALQAVLKAVIQTSDLPLEIRMEIVNALSAPPPMPQMPPGGNAPNAPMPQGNPGAPMGAASAPEMNGSLTH